MRCAAPTVYCGPVWRIRVRVAPETVLSDEEREVLDDLIRSKLTSVRLALRTRSVLLAGQGFAEQGHRAGAGRRTHSSLALAGALSRVWC